MQTPAFKLKPLHTFTILMTCVALAAGCAGNQPGPVKSKTTPTTRTSLESSSSPVTTSDSQPVSALPEEIKKETVLTASKDVQAQPTEERPASAEPKPVDTDHAVIQQPAQMTFYFGFNKTDLDEQDKAILKEHALFLKANPDLVLQIDGHTDHSGPHDYNEFLSKQRAESVARVLIADGIQRSQLVIKALADNKPLTDNSAPGKNRRVELQYNEMDMLTSR